MINIFDKNKVLVPIDFSEESMEALKITVKYVEDISNCYVVHVLRRLNPGEPGVVWHKVDDNTRKAHMKKVFLKNFSGPEYEQVNFEVTIGNPTTEIINYTKNNDIDLIVIPTHGRTGLKHFLLGSVAEKVIRYAPCPVLVLRNQEMIRKRLKETKKNQKNKLLNNN